MNVCPTSNEGSCCLHCLRYSPQVWQRAMEHTMKKYVCPRFFPSASLRSRCTLSPWLSQLADATGTPLGIIQRLDAACRHHDDDEHLRRCDTRGHANSAGQSCAHGSEEFGLTDSNGLSSVCKSLETGGERGIRTLDTLSSIHAFQACAFSHSAISPRLQRGGKYVLDCIACFRTALLARERGTQKGRHSLR